MFVHGLIMFYICTKFHVNISKGFRTISLLNFLEGHNSIKIGVTTEVTIFNLCIWSDDALYLYQVYKVS